MRPSAWRARPSGSPATMASTRVWASACSPRIRATTHCLRSARSRSTHLPSRSARRLRTMADLTQKDRLQPSLLDRLTDNDPERKQESRDSRVLSPSRLRDCVRRDLVWLLNTTHLRPSRTSTSYPLVARLGSQLRPARPGRAHHLQRRHHGAGASHPQGDPRLRAAPRGQQLAREALSSTRNR